MSRVDTFKILSMKSLSQVITASFLCSKQGRQFREVMELHFSFQTLNKSFVSMIVGGDESKESLKLLLSPIQ
jgi:hypothetical protein